MKRNYLLLIFAFYTLVSVFLLNPDIGCSIDGSIYLLLSQSLVSGLGYRNLYHPSCPPQTTFPFFYPLLLAMIRLFFESIFVLKCLSLIFGFGSLITLELIRKMYPPS